MFMQARLLVTGIIYQVSFDTLNYWPNQHFCVEKWHNIEISFLVRIQKIFEYQTMVVTPNFDNRLCNTKDGYS